MSGAALGTAGTAALVGGAASAVGAGVSAYANNQALRKQDRIASDSIKAQAAQQSQADQVVKKTVQDTATNEQANLQANQQKQQNAYLEALQRAAPTQNASSPAVAGASKAYADATTKATADNATFGRTLASQMATTDAPQLTQLGTNLKLGDASTQLGLINDTSNRQANLAKLQEQAVTANPWLSAAGQFISGAGNGYASSAGGSNYSKYGKIPKGGVGVSADNGLATSLSGTNA